MENRGGSVGSKGYNFQDLCAIKYFFEYIENEEFENLTVEQINDFTIRLKIKEISVQVKSEHITKTKLFEISEKATLDWVNEFVVIAPSWEMCIEKIVQKKNELFNAKETNRNIKQINIIEMQLKKIIEDTGLDVDFVLKCTFDKLSIKEQREVVLYRIRKWLDKYFFQCDENIILDSLISYVSRQRENRGFITKETLIEIVKGVGGKYSRIDKKITSMQTDIILSDLKKERVKVPAASANIDNIIMHIEMKNYEQAYIKLMELENNFGKDFSQYKVWILIKLQNWKEAKKVCDEILREKDILNFQWCFFYKGVIAFETKRYKSAFNYLNKYIVKFGNMSFEAALYLAKTEIIIKKKLEHAKELLLFCKAIYDNNSEVFFELSKLCPLHEEVDYLEKVLQLDTNHMKARYKLSEDYRLMGLNREAYNSYKIYFQKGVHESDWKELAGYIYCLLNLGKQDEAEAYIKFFIKAFLQSRENRLKEHESMVLMDCGKDNIYVISCMMLSGCYYFETPIGQIKVPVRSRSVPLSDKTFIGVIPDWFLAMNENLNASISGKNFDIEVTWKPVLVTNYQNDFDFLAFKSYLVTNKIIAINHDWVETVENEEGIALYDGLKTGDQLHYIEYIVNTGIDIHIFEYESRIQVDLQYLEMKSNASFIKGRGYFSFKRVLQQSTGFSWIIYSVNRKEMIEIRIPTTYLKIDCC